MSYRRPDGIVVIEPEPDSECQVCGKLAECRPYGPGGISICFGCGMKDAKATNERMGVILFGNKPRSRRAS